jgi:hypothetical protein
MNFCTKRIRTGTTQPPVQRERNISPGLNRPGRHLNHPSVSIAEIKERVELLIYYTSGSSWRIID